MSENTPGKKVSADGKEYHVSATANATVAPTNQVTLINAVPGADLGSEKLEFITLVHFEYSNAGQVDHEHIRTTYGYTTEEYETLIKDVGIVRALVARGIDARHLITKTDESIKAKITPIQLIAANRILDLTDNRSIRKKLQDIGVTTQMYSMWLRDPNFKEYLNNRSEGLLGDIHHEALITLADKVTAGDVKAQELYFEMTGRFVKQSASNGGGAVGDIQQIVVRIIEIIVDEVDDVDTANRIVDRLKGLVLGNQVAGVLATPEVIVPEIAPARVMTNEVQQLMAKGGGFND